MGALCANLKDILVFGKGIPETDLQKKLLKGPFAQVYIQLIEIEEDTMAAKSVRAMTEADLNEVVKIHKIAFKGFFLEQMGSSFVKTYYKIALAYEGSIAYVFVGKNNLIEGFVVGFVEPAMFYNKFIRSSFKLVFPIFSGIIHNPKLLLKIFENIKRVVSSGYQNSKFVLDKYTAELSSIAVITPAKGIGSLLIDAFTKDAWSRGLINVTLTTNFDNNELANNFYIKHGFTKNGLEFRKGRKLCRYILSKVDHMRHSTFQSKF